LDGMYEYFCVLVNLCSHSSFEEEVSRRVVDGLLVYSYIDKIRGGS
jgi:hypothetical protein